MTSRISKSSLHVDLMQTRRAHRLKATCALILSFTYLLRPLEPAKLLQFVPARHRSAWSLGGRVTRKSQSDFAPTSTDYSDGLAAAVELKDLLRGGSQVDQAHIKMLIDKLISLRVAFNPKFFGGGLWQAIHTVGDEPKWQRNARMIPFQKNIAGQEYNPEQQRVINYGEVLGKSLFFFAEGRFQEANATITNCPKDYDVFVERGGLNVFGWKVALPIEGRGYLRCLYADSTMRIFISPKSSPDNWEEEGLIVVQMPMSLIDPSWRPPYEQG